MGVVYEIYWLIVNLRDLGLWVFIRDAKRSSIGWKLFELHDIASQSASFVWEDVLYLAKLFVDVSALSATVKVLLIIKHINVIVHEAALEKFDHLKSNKKWYWDEVAENENPTAGHGHNHVA